jgi:uncharacterized protein (UPF0548 family)
VVVELLAPNRVALLRTEQLTYPEIGRTAGELPQDYRIINRTARLPAGTDFDRAAHNLLHWQVQQRAGLRVAASSERITPQAVVVLRIGIGPLAVQAPCRVVYVIDEPDRRGFAYGTLPGHPESGEEAFILERPNNGTVTFTVTAFSRPASTLAKLAAPLGRYIQNIITTRYLHAFNP